MAENCLSTENCPYSGPDGACMASAVKRLLAGYSCQLETGGQPICEPGKYSPNQRALLLSIDKSHPQEGDPISRWLDCPQALELHMVHMKMISPKRLVDESS